MTDRELLEAAAKAAGMSEMLAWTPGATPWLRVNPDLSRPWNPLTDDGDALRLAHALRLNIEPQTTMGGKPVGFNVWPVGRGDCGVTEDGDSAADLRRAIVRAAAALEKEVL
jgi:hypothetical protein